MTLILHKCLIRTWIRIIKREILYNQGRSVDKILEVANKNSIGQNRIPFPSVPGTTVSNQGFFPLYPQFLVYVFSFCRFLWGKKYLMKLENSINLTPNDNTLDQISHFILHSYCTFFISKYFIILRTASKYSPHFSFIFSRKPRK